MSTAAGSPAWRTSSLTSNGQSCVEVAPGSGLVQVRDTKDAGLGVILLLDRAAWDQLRVSALNGTARGGAGIEIVHEVRHTEHSGQRVATVWHLGSGGRTLHFTESEWTAFAAGVRAGEFDFAPAR